jgi:integrase
MPTLIKRDGSKYWIACFDVPQPDGSTRRLKKSTKRTKRADAMTEAIKLEEAERKEGTATSEQATKAFAVLTQAAEAAARGELSEARGRELLAALVEISTGSPLRFFTVRTWGAEWLAMKAATSKPATNARYSASVKAFLAWLGDRADGKLEVVTKADVRGFRDAIRAGWTAKAGTASKQPARTASTANDFTSDIAGMFRAAVREGLLLASPAAALDKLPEHDSTEREVFTVAEVGQLVSAAADPAWLAGFIRESPEATAARCTDWPGMILLGFYAGARLGDCAGMTGARLTSTGAPSHSCPPRRSGNGSGWKCPCTRALRHGLPPERKMPPPATRPRFSPCSASPAPGGTKGFPLSLSRS